MITLHLNYIVAPRAVQNQSNSPLYSYQMEPHDLIEEFDPLHNGGYSAPLQIIDRSAKVLSSRLPPGLQKVVDVTRLPLRFVVALLIKGMWYRGSIIKKYEEGFVRIALHAADREDNGDYKYWAFARLERVHEVVDCQQMDHNPRLFVDESRTKWFQEQDVRKAAIIEPFTNESDVLNPHTIDRNRPKHVQRDTVSTPQFQVNHARLVSLEPRAIDQKQINRNRNRPKYVQRSTPLFQVNHARLLSLSPRAINQKPLERDPISGIQSISPMSTSNTNRRRRRRSFENMKGDPLSMRHPKRRKMEYDRNTPIAAPHRPYSMNQPKPKVPKKGSVSYYQYVKDSYLSRQLPLSFEYQCEPSPNRKKTNEWKVAEELIELFNVLVDGEQGEVISWELRDKKTFNALKNIFNNTKLFENIQIATKISNGGSETSTTSDFTTLNIGDSNKVIVTMNEEFEIQSVSDEKQYQFLNHQDAVGGSEKRTFYLLKDQSGQWSMISALNFIQIVIARRIIRGKVMIKLEIRNADRYINDEEIPILQQFERAMQSKVKNAVSDVNNVSASSPGITTNIHTVSPLQSVRTESTHSLPSLGTINGNLLDDALCSGSLGPSDLSQSPDIQSVRKSTGSKQVKLAKDGFGELVDIKIDSHWSSGTVIKRYPDGNIKVALHAAEVTLRVNDKGQYEIDGDSNSIQSSNHSVQRSFPRIPEIPVKCFVILHFCPFGARFNCILLIHRSIAFAAKTEQFQCGNDLF